MFTEEIKCPHCGEKEKIEYEDYDLEEDGDELDIYYYYNCKECNHPWRYVEHFKLEYAYNWEGR